MDTDLFKLELLGLAGLALCRLGEHSLQQGNSEAPNILIKQTQRAPAREPSFLTHVLMFGTRV